MNAMELSARLSLDASNFHKGMQNAESGFKSFGNRLKSIGGAMVKTVVAGAAAATAAFVAVGKRSIDAYANYEQLTGGIETLFKTSAKTMMKYAEQAYKTSGVSANKYMEMSTSFAASLISGLKGDTAKAAEMANMAIVDMSDNANKMGTDLTMIQNAYQGFAKQNYTMLDNLKLGYGGTKTEMERLLADAGKLTGKKFNVSNFADIVQAIHAIQTQMDITGTTSKEASTTISGSMNMVKAAWEDMLVEMSKPQEASKGFKFIQDESEATAKSITKGPQAATQKFIASVKTMLGNVLPAVRNFISNFGDVVAAIAPMIGEELPQLLADFLPKFFEAGKNLVVGIGRGITKAFQTFKWPTWKEVQAGAQKAWQGIQQGVETLGGLVFGTDPDTGAVKWPTWKDVKAGAQAAWDAIRNEAAHLVGAVVYGTDENGQVKWPEWDGNTSDAQKVWDTVVAGASKIGSAFGAIIYGTDEQGQVKWPEWDNDTSGLQKVWDTIKQAASNAGDAIGALVYGKDGETGEVKWPDWDGDTTGLQKIWETVKQAASNVTDTIGAFVYGKDEATGKVQWPNWDGDTSGAEKVWDTIKQAASGLTDEVGSFVYGTDGATGKVNWPKWDEDTSDLSKIWETVKGAAAKIGNDIGGFVFGSDEATGKVNWPKWDGDTSGADEVWNAVKEYAAGLAGLVFGKNDATGEINYPDPNKLGQDINSWWNEKVLPAISSVGQLVFGEPEIGDADGSGTTQKINNWWESIVKPGLKLVADFSLGVLGFDNFEQLSTQVYSWFQDKFGWLYELLGVDKKPSEHNYSEEQYRMDRAGYEATLTTKPETVSGAGAQYVISQIKAIDDLLKGGTAKEFTQFANEMIAMSDTSGGKGLFSEQTIEALNAMKEAGEATPNELQALAQMVQGDLMNAITGIGNGFTEAQGQVNNFATSLASLPRNIDIVVNFIPGTRIGGYSGSFNTVGQFKFPGLPHAKGDWNIPYNNYPAILHRDEMVLTASQARQYREGQSNGIDAATLASAMRSAVLDLTMEFNGREVGRMFGDSTTARVNRNIGQINRRRRYGYGG